MHLISSLISGSIALAAVLFFPIAHLILTAANLVVHCGILGLQLLLTRSPVKRPEAALPVDEEPFVSIHVPTHNEPPEVVMQTLQSLAHLKWENYEVLVIDNNTSDPKLWEPIKEYCGILGPRFRFFHVEGLKGFKAGAMNYVRQFMDPRAKFIFVVDADYVVDRKALRTALRYRTEEKIGLIQFPQDYRNVTKANVGIALDYKHFFSGFMNMGNAMGCVPSTGTLALVSVEALREIGGFNSECVTEDADLGFRLATKGYRSIYVNQVIGSGLLPHEMDGLKKQRWRWAFGNAQILRHHWKELLFSKTLTWKQKMGFVAHLTAWFNFNLVPSLSLILLALYSVVGDLNESQIYTVVISGFTLVTYLFLKYGVMHYSLRREGYSLPDISRAFVTHVGLGWIFCASWVRCLFNSSSPFVRTNKFISRAVPGVLKTTMADIGLGVGLLGAAVVLTLTDFILGPIAALVTCATRFAVYWVCTQTAHTLQATARLFPAEATVEKLELTRAA